MARIYDEKLEPLGELLARAYNDSGATLLIPNLQRPFVWTPNQVSLLIDSLVRGWPFGTLLLWRVHNLDIANIPPRGLWKRVDRTDAEEHQEISRQDPPGEYQMILDGQQRVQSLLLALNGDNWGFKMYDSDWADELANRRPRGKQATENWTQASLCFDLDVFLDEYERTHNIFGIDYSGKVLKWLVTDPVNGRSNTTSLPISKGPVEDRFAEANSKRYVRLSRLWDKAGANQMMKEANYRDLLRPFLGEYAIEPERSERLLQPLAEFLTTLRDVKLNKVSYLEITRYDPSVWTADDYSDAVVNIFTRLNTAGRTLTREEITFAWLKTGWVDAYKSFQSLRDELLSSHHLDITMDELVNMVSLVWAITHRPKGEPLSNQDLLKGEYIRPMAQDLANIWATLRSSILETAEVLEERYLEYGRHFLSLNAFALLWTIDYMGRQRSTSFHAGTMDDDAYGKALKELLARNADRWLICSQWAGRWAASSRASVMKYAEEAHAEYLAIDKLSDPKEVLQLLDRRLASWIDDVRSEALGYVDGLNVRTRSRVSMYHVPLWVWHRLATDRWDLSKVQLRTTRRKKTTLDVDHIAPHALWEEKLQSLNIPNKYEYEDMLRRINQIGNCFLLEKTFNVAKGKKPLDQFLDDVYEFKEGRVELGVWAKALALDMGQINSAQTTPDRLAVLFAERTQKIKSDLQGFVNGSLKRIDV